MPDAPRPRWIEWVVDHAWWFVAVAAVLGVAGAVAGHKLSLDRSIENMFAPDDPILASYRQLQRTFGRHDTVLAVYSDPEMTTPAGIKRIESLKAKLDEVPGVVSTVALTDLPGGTAFDDQGVGERFRAMFAGYTHNAELTAAGVVCLTERPGPGKPSRRAILAPMREIIADYPQGALVGEPVMIEEAFDLLDADGNRLTTWATVLVMLVIVACFRSLRWIVLPLAVVQLSLHATRGILAASGLELSMVSSMLAAIVTVIGVAIVVHVMVHYLDVRRGGVPRRAALIQTIDELKVPIFYAVLTDAAGFAALMVSSVGPIHDFGLMMAIGAMMTLPATALLFPGLAMIGDSDRLPPREKNGPLTAVLMRLLHWSNTHASWFIVATVVLTVFSLWGSARLERETAFTNNFRSHTKIIQAYNFVEDEFGGAGVWDLLIPVGEAPEQPPTPGEPSLPPLSGETLTRVLDLQKQLLAESPGELNRTMSLADAVAASLGPNVLTRAPAFVLRGALGTMRAKIPHFIASMHAVDPEDGRPWLRIALRSPERLPADEKIKLIERVEATANKQFPGATATGYYVLLARLIESMLDDQWKTFAVASVAVALMTIVAFRNIPLAVATMIPNILPVMALFGAMGWLGIKTNMGAAMIAAVSVGLSIDNSIHYVMLYQHRRRQGMTLDEGLADAQDSAGRAATLSTLALIVGFAALCVSDFIPTVYFGALVSLSMLGGLVGNILVQPMLIRKLDRRVYVGEGI